MGVFFTEEKYENSVIELFENMGYSHVTVPILKGIFTVHYMRRFCLTLCIV